MQWASRIACFFYFSVLWSPALKKTTAFVHKSFSRSEGTAFGVFGMISEESYSSREKLDFVSGLTEPRIFTEGGP